MIDTNPETLFKKGLESLARHEWTVALACFEKAAGLQNIPVHNSFLALCIARERGQTNKAVALCMATMEAEPDNPVLYLNLGKIYLMQGKTEKAIEVYRKGLIQGTNEEIIAELRRIGNRRPPPLSFLHRDHPLNKYLGIILSRLGLRR
jgi:tetratricopeptide (TPR) repeat protein